MIKEWRKVNPDWGAWRSVLYRIYRKQRVYIAVAADVEFEAELQAKLSGGYVTDNTNPPGLAYRVAEIVESVNLVTIGPYVTMAAIPARVLNPTHFIGFVAGAQEPNWERFRMQLCMRVATEIITGKLPDHVRPAMVSIGRVDNNPVLFGGAIYAPEGVLEELLDYMEFGNYNPDGRSWIITPRYRSKEVSLEAD